MGTNIFVGSGIVAEQLVHQSDDTHSTEWEEVLYKHEDIVTGSYQKTTAAGTLAGGMDPPASIEFEPLGGAVPQSDPNMEDDGLQPNPLSSFKYFGDVGRSAFGCLVDGHPSDLCFQLLQSGIAVPNRTFEQSLQLGYWVDEDGPPVHPDDPDTISGSSVQTRFVPFLFYTERLLTTEEVEQLDAARNRLVKRLGRDQHCRDELARLLAEVNPIRYGRLQSRNGQSFDAAAAEVYDEEKQASPLLQRYSSMSIMASGKSVVGSDGSTTYMSTAFKRIWGSGPPDSASVTINKDFFRLSTDQQMLHVLHEVFHQVATDIELANAIARLEKKKKTYQDSTIASRALNDWLMQECQLPRD